MAKSLIAVGGADRRADKDLDVGTQPPRLRGQRLDLLARAGAGGKQHDTPADDREVPTHSRSPAVAHRNHRRHHGSLLGKELQILKEAVPAASKIAYLCSYWDTGQWVRDSGQRLGIAVIRIPVEEATASQFRPAFAQMAQERLDAVMVSGAGEFLANRQPIVDFAANSRLPGMYPYRDFVEAGGLMAYAPDLGEQGRQLADQVRRVLGGTKPSDIPIYQPTTFKLIVNLKAAKAQGFTVPQLLLEQADEVIE